MSDDAYCWVAKNRFEAAKSEYVNVKRRKDNIEEDLRIAGERIQTHEYERNDVVNELRDVEQDIRSAREKEEPTDYLENKRNEIVSNLRFVEDRLSSAREHADNLKGQQYQISSEFKDKKDELDSAISDVKQHCSDPYGGFGIDLSIPD